MGFLTTAQPPASNALSRDNYRVLIVRQPCPFTLGDVLQGPGAKKLLLMEHPDDESWATQFKAAYVTHEFQWKRQATIMHPVAHIPMANGEQDLGTLFSTIGDPRDRNLAQMVMTEYEGLTGQDVRVGDQLGTLIVKTVHEVLGVKLFHAE